MLLPLRRVSYQADAVDPSQADWTYRMVNEKWGLLVSKQAETHKGMHWTLLEVGNLKSCREPVPFMMSSGVDIRLLPPELATPARGNADALYKPACDMWMLGQVVYQVIKRRPYWSSLNDDAILRVMEDPQHPLPHEVDPLTVPEEQSIVASLLQRDPQLRMTAAGFVKQIGKAQTFIVPDSTLNRTDVSYDSDTTELTE